MHLEIFDMILMGLATWRISSLLVREDGPYYVFKKIRERCGFEYDNDGSLVSYPSNHVLRCTWCTSFWVAIVVMFVPTVILWPFAVSASAIVVDKVVNKWQ